MQELLKLATMLANIDANFSMRKLYDGYQITIYKGDEPIDDVVWHSGSHGYSEGLLETCNLSDCQGYETATEVFDGWERMFLELEDEQ